MNKTTITSIEVTLLKEFLRRNLIKYFIDKGNDDNFLVSVNPTELFDLTSRLPFLRNMVEVKFYIEDYDLQNNVIKVGWNVFVLGNHRIFLGYSIHNNLLDIERQRRVDVGQGNVSIKQFVNEVTDVIGATTHIFDIHKKEYGVGDSTKSRFVSATKPTNALPDFRRKV
jgi:hypothetical protein